MKTILALLLALCCGLLGWIARGQFGQSGPQAGSSDRVTTVQRPAAKAPPRASAPRPATPAARTASEALGNTDGGYLPWNGGDRYMGDYSRSVRPASAGNFQ